MYIYRSNASGAQENRVPNHEGLRPNPRFRQKGLGVAKRALTSEKSQREAWRETDESHVWQGLSHPAHEPAGRDRYLNPYMRLNEVLSLVPVSASTVWRWARTGKLTAIKIGPRITVFSRAQVMDVFSSEAAR